MILITDKHKHLSFIDYSSIKWRSIVRPVLGAQKIGPEDACDAAIFIQHDRKQILHKSLKIKIITESETQSNEIIRNAWKTERGLMVDIKPEREPWNDLIIQYVVWVRKSCNLDHSLTKADILLRIVDMMETGKLYYKIEQSVKRNTVKIPKTSRLEKIIN